MLLQLLQLAIWVTVTIWCANRDVQGFAPGVIGLGAAWLVTVAPVLAVDSLRRRLGRISSRGALVGQPAHHQIIGNRARPVAVGRKRG